MEDQQLSSGPADVVDLTGPDFVDLTADNNNIESPERSSSKRPRSESPAKPEPQCLAVPSSPGEVAGVCAPARTPGRDTNALPEHLVEHWGSCYRCGQPGHFKSDCPLNSTPVKARFRGFCKRCNAPIQIGANVTRNDTGDSWFHVKCQLGDVAAKVSRRRLPQLFLQGADAEHTSNSAYDSAIHQFVHHGTGHGLIVSAAGSGKTHQLVQVYKDVHRMGLTARVCVFNKDAAAELQSREVPKDAARTFHSFGWQAWRQQHSSCKVDGKKIRKILNEMYPIENCQGPKTSRTKKSVETAFFGKAVEQLVSLAKQQGVGVEGLARDEDSFWMELYKRHNLDYQCKRALRKMSEPRKKYVEQVWPVAVAVRDAVMSIAREALGESKTLSATVVDYDDQLYMPLLEGLVFAQVDWVLVDEAQDSNPVRRRAALKMLKPGSGRLLAVGDPCQSINGFCGASSDALKVCVVLSGG